MTDVLFYALAAGILLTLVTGPLGALVVWQRMAYYGDTLAHSALLGVALGLALQVSVLASVLVTCVVLAVVLSTLQRWRATTVDSLLGIFAHGSLALGLVVVALTGSPALDLNAFLFGDLLAVDGEHLTLLAAIVAAVAALLLWYWKPLVATAAHTELAAVEGLPVHRLRTLMMVLIAVTVAAAMHIVGVLLITALLIIPAATASRLGRSPEEVAAGASLCGALAVIGGLSGAWVLDTPAGATIVVGAGLLFGLTQLLPRARQA